MKDVSLWVDDIRPAPKGWVHAYDVPAAKLWLQEGGVVRASLDHDLGACDPCLASGDSCRHVLTGLDLVNWMVATGHWPVEKPTVHSQNPVGAGAMWQLICRHFPG